MANSEKLREIMASADLGRDQVAELLGVSVHTVSAWLLPATSKRRRSMPDRQIEFLKLKLGA